MSLLFITFNDTDPHPCKNLYSILCIGSKGTLRFDRRSFVLLPDVVTETITNKQKKKKVTDGPYGKKSGETDRYRMVR